MTHRNKMLEYLARTEDAIAGRRGLVPVIQREVERRFGRKVASAKTQQERDNLRQYYWRQVAQENIWWRMYTDDRDVYMSLATMYGIATLVEQTSAIQNNEVF